MPLDAKLLKKDAGQGGPGGGFFSNSPIQRGKPSEQDTISIDKYLKGLQASPEAEGVVETPIAEQATQGHQAPWQVYHDYPLSRKKWKVYDPAEDPGVMNNPERRHYGLPLPSESISMVGSKQGADKTALTGLWNDLMHPTQQEPPMPVQQPKGDVCPTCGGGLTRRYKDDGSRNVELICTHCTYAPKTADEEIPEDSRPGGTGDYDFYKADVGTPAGKEEQEFLKSVSVRGSLTASMLKKKSSGEFGLRWQEWGKDNRMVTKEKFFTSSELREGFANKLEDKDSFKEFVAWSGPKEAALKIARPTEQKIELLKKQGLTDEQIEQCIATDPTEKDYVQWIASQFKKKLIRLPEDSGKIKNQLLMFRKLKNSPNFKGEKDIARYTPATLFEAVGEGAKTNEQGETKVEIPWEQMSQKDKDRWYEKNLPGIRQKILAGEQVQGAKTLVNQQAAGTKIEKIPTHDFAPQAEDPDKCANCEYDRWHNIHRSRHNREATVDVMRQGEFTFRIFEVADVKALMAITSGTNWCTKGEQHATHYLEAGPNYVFFLDDQPYAQWDPNSGQFLDPKDNKFSLEKADISGYWYVEDNNVRTFLQLLKGTGFKVPAKMNRFMLSREDVQQKVQERDEAGTLTLRQRYEKNGLKGIQLTPEQQQQLATQGNANDILFYCQTGLGKGISSNKYQSNWTRWPEAEPRLLATMTSIGPVLTYWDKIGQYKRWPEFEDAFFALIPRQKGKTASDNLIKYQDDYSRKTSYDVRLTNALLQQDMITRAHSYLDTCKVGRSPEFETFVVQQRNFAQAATYYCGKSEYHSGQGRHSGYTSIGPSRIKPQRWPEFEAIAEEAFQAGDQKNFPYIKQYKENCSPFAWPSYDNFLVTSLVPLHQKMEESLTLKVEKTEEGERQTYLSSYEAERAYYTALGAMLTQAIKDDMELPALDTELRWFAKFYKVKKEEFAAHHRRPGRNQYESEHDFDSAIKALVPKIQEYKSLAWDRKASSLKRKAGSLESLARQHKPHGMCDLNNPVCKAYIDMRIAYPGWYPERLGSKRAGFLTEAEAKEAFWSAVDEGKYAVGDDGTIIDTRDGNPRGRVSSSKLECCGGWHNRHKPNCKVYNDNFNSTVEKLKALPKKGSFDPQLSTFLASWVAVLVGTWMGKRNSGMTEKLTNKATQVLQKAGVSDLPTLDRYAQDSGMDRYKALGKLALQQLALSAALTLGVSATQLLKKTPTVEAAPPQQSQAVQPSQPTEAPQTEPMIQGPDIYVGGPQGEQQDREQVQQKMQQLHDQDQNNPARREKTTSLKSNSSLQGEHSSIGLTASMLMRATEDKRALHPKTPQVAAGALQGFIDSVNEGDNGDNIYEFLDYLKTNYRADTPENLYDEFETEAVRLYKQKPKTSGMFTRSKEDDILIPGVQVFHRNLRLHGVVVEPWVWGLILDSVLVDFEDGETREVSRHLLDIE